MDDTTLQRLRDNDPTLTELYVSYMNIGDEGATALSEALKVNTTLKILYVSGNEIGDDGATALSEALKANTTLMELKVSFNNIGDVGATALSEALKVNTTLTTLNVSDNNIGDVGAIALSEALKVNTTLRELYVSYNNDIGYAGATALSEVLKKNYGLVRVYGATREYEERNKYLHQLARQRVEDAIVALLIVRKRLALQVIDKNIFKDIANQMRRDMFKDLFMWLTPREAPGRGTYGVQDTQSDTKRRKTNIESCVACYSDDAAYADVHDRRFCGSYCQMIHHYGLPDVRGMTPAQIAVALK